MAKVKFSKFKFESPEVKTITFQGQEIEVKTYLPINEKLILIGNVINFSADELKFYNVGKLKLFFTLEVIFNYTNISFTDKQKEDVCKLYDNVVYSGLYDLIIDAIGYEEIELCKEILEETTVAIYEYNNSFVGIVDALSQKYENSKFDLTELSQKLSDPNALPLLKEIVGKLG